MTLIKSKGSVWDDLYDDPEEAALMKAKSRAFDGVLEYVLSVDSKMAMDTLGATPEQIELIRANRFYDIDLDELKAIQLKIPK